jgi:hypothetical protein
VTDGQRNLNHWKKLDDEGEGGIADIVTLAAFVVRGVTHMHHPPPLPTLCLLSASSPSRCFQCIICHLSSIINHT